MTHPMAAGFRAIGLSLVMFGWAVTAAALPGGNKLATEASPYLQSHAEDAVHWRPWSVEALAEARRLKRPILLSIGYLACHWCHVMQRESFVAGESAALINALFVPVLIDREERPDLDAFFQHSANALDLPTGWPLTMFLTDAGEPFFGATYIPANAGLGMPALADVLRHVNAAWREDPQGIRKDAAMLTRSLAAASWPRADDVTPAERAAAAKAYFADADVLGGGFGSASKFPHWPALMLVWRQSLRADDKALGDFVAMSLREMARGGLHDHVGGGFFRYTTDPVWRQPHFEKMLDVNAGMIRVMTQVWRETRDPELEQAIAGTVAFLARDMRHASGAFISSLDADSLKTDGGEDVEGAFYRWREADIRAALGPDAEPFLQAYAVALLDNAPGEPEPEWGTLYRVGSAISDADLERLRKARAVRPKPRRDTKILAAANGLAVRALAEAGRALRRPDWVAMARQAFAAARRALQADDKRLHQSAVVDGQGVRRGPPATLSALAAMAHGALALLEAGGEPAYLDQAQAWARLIIAHHADTRRGGYFAAADDAPAVVVRLRPVFDNPNPSGNGAAISLFARLYFHDGAPVWRDRAVAAIKALGGVARVPDIGTAGLISAADDLMAALQIVIIGRRDTPGGQTLLAALVKRSLPGEIVQVVEPGAALPAAHPAIGKTQIDGKPTAYVCRGTVCSLPAINAAELDENLAIFRKDAR